MKFTREEITAYFCGEIIIKGINEEQRVILEYYKTEWNKESTTIPQYIMDDYLEDMCFMALCPAVFVEYRDKAGTGSEIGFTSEEEAITYAKAEWNKLCEADKKSYRDDVAGNFTVYDRVEAVEIWSAPF